MVLGVFRGNSAAEPLRSAQANKYRYCCLSGRAEFILPDLLKKEASENNKNRRLVAIVDPPRAGLHPKAVTALRAATEIQTLIYVSCDAKAAMQVR